MTVSFVSNLASTYAQSSIKTRSDKVTSNTLALSTGSRVFDASQDSAALAVGSGLKIDNAGLASARINAGAGVSTLQIADGALGNAADILVRMKTLAVQSASGNLSDFDRAPIDLEFQNLKSELGRLAGATNFNGVQLLNGQPSYLIDKAATVTTGVIGIAFAPSGVTGNPTLRYSYDATTERMTLTRTDGATTASQVLDLTALMDATAGVGHNLGTGQRMELNFQSLGVTLTLDETFARGTNILPTLTDNTGANIDYTTGAFVPAAANLTTEGVDGLQALVGGYNTTSGDLTLPIASNGTNVTLGPLAGVRFSVNGGGVGASGAASADIASGAAGYVDVYVDTAGGYENIGRITFATVTTTGAGTGNIVVSAGKGLQGATLQTASADTVLNYKVDTGILLGQDILQITIPPINVPSLGITNSAVRNQSLADNAIDELTTAINIVSRARATVGAQQSRLSAVTQSIDVFRENNEKARSSLMDTDVPATITELANNQATLQAGVAMLAQTNQIPNMLLQLLRN